jgi:hypothetical protein
MNKLTTKIIMTITIMVMAAAIGFAQESGELLIPLSSPGQAATLDVSIKRGKIVVLGTNRQDVLIKYKSREQKEKKKATQEGLTRISSGGLDLKAEENNNTVKVRSESYSNGVDLTIEVPNKIDLRIESYNNGDIDIQQITGDLEIENYNGAISATGISGSANANTYNGGITVELLKVTNDIPMSFNTYNGDVDITLPATVKASLKLKSSRGEVYTGFEVAMSKAPPVKKTESDSGTYKVYLDDWVKGNINGGGPEFTMKNYNGDIYIRKK